MLYTGCWYVLYYAIAIIISLFQPTGELRPLFSYAIRFVFKVLQPFLSYCRLKKWHITINHADGRLMLLCVYYNIISFWIQYPLYIVPISILVTHLCILNLHIEMSSSLLVEVIWGRRAKFKFYENSGEMDLLDLHPLSYSLNVLQKSKTWISFRRITVKAANLNGV